MLFAYFFPIWYSEYMKKNILLILVATLGLSSFLWINPLYADWWCAWNWGTACANPGEISYCKWGTCGITQGETAVSTATNGLFSNKPLSVFITDVVKYFLSFVSIVGIIYVLFAGFQIMTWWGDEEKVKKARQIIIYVCIGIVLMWLSYWIVMLILDAIK